MEIQKSLFDGTDIFNEDVFIEAFDKGEPDNESEYDVVQHSTPDFIEMVTSGADWTIGTISDQIRRGRIILDPMFQRRDAWTKKAKSRFIESLFLGIPIPQVILAEAPDKRGTYLVIDGKQRLLSIKSFVLGAENGSSPLRLTGLDIKTEFNGKTYLDLQRSEYAEEVPFFENQPIRTIVVKNWPSIESLYILFWRLNTGSVKLSPQELRQAIFPGEFTKYLDKASSASKMLQRILNISSPDFRMRDVEVMLRFLAFHFYLGEYSGSMQLFLDNACKNLNKYWNDKKVAVYQMVEAMEYAMQSTFSIFGVNAFKKYKGDNYEKKYNRAVIDIMLYFFSDRNIVELAKVKSSEIMRGFELLCKEDALFLDSLETTTKSMSAVTYRFGVWRKTLCKILDIEIQPTPLE